jgi:uncharacterized protein (TIGR03067 family)
MYALVLCFTLTAPAPKQEAPKLLGTWNVEKVIAMGKEQAQPPGLRLTFKDHGRCLSQEDENERVTESKYKIDMSQNPPHIEMHPAYEGAKHAALGIFKIEGDTLTICVSMKGARATKFESTELGLNVLMTYKRAK